MERYSWIILLGVLAIISLSVFFIFLYRDMVTIKKLEKSKKSLWLDFTLLILSISCIAVALMVYLNIQEQLKLFGLQNLLET